MPYKHGVYGSILPSKAILLHAEEIGTLPVYVGTAPVQQLSDYSEAINKPIFVTSFDEAKTLLGYSDDWSTFTLCEAMYAHYENDITSVDGDETGSVSPIVLINVMDPVTDKTAGTASVTLINKKGYIDVPVILSSVAVTGFTKYEDYTVEYTEEGRVLFTAINAAITSPVTVSFDKMDKTAVSNADIIGGIDENTGKRTGLACVDLIYQQFGVPPTILAAPGWSHNTDVYEALVSKCQKINGHWDAVCAIDIDSSASGAKTITAAINLKQTNNFTSEYAKPCWPMAKYEDKVYHMSTIAVVRMVQTDYENDNTPHVSPSNKQIMASGTVLADGNAIEFDEPQANQLNAEGITTAIYAGGQWRLWGPHMGNYKYGEIIKAEKKFDASIRMMQYLTNHFQLKFMSDVDDSFGSRQIKSILDDAQIWLNSLIAESKLIYAKILFNRLSNPDAKIVEGDFTFDVSTTTMPVGKSMTFNVRYTPTGLNSLFVR